MEVKSILKIEKPTTQSLEAIKALLSWRGRASDPLPSFVEMGQGESRLVLVLSNKKDCFYVVTATECSCPARNWHHNGPCKHMRKYFNSDLPNHGRALLSSAEPPTRKPFKPFLEDEARPVKATSSIPIIDTLGEPTPGELAYHSIQEDKAMWPAEA